MNRLKEAIPGYGVYFPMVYAIAFYLRMCEAFLIEHRHDIHGIYRDVLNGFLLDIPVVTLLLFALFPLYYLLLFRNPKTARAFILSALILLLVNHLFILQYFSYFLIPLNRFLQANTIREMIFSVSTSDIDAGQGFLWLVLMVLGVILVLFFSKTIQPGRLSRGAVFGGIIVSLMWLSGSSAFVKTTVTDRITQNVLINKSLFFYKVIFHGSHRQELTEITPEIISKVQESMPGLHFTSGKYPLLNRAGYEDVLSPFLKLKDTPPNIVLVIVEGLGTRFLEPSEGINLMPFLDSLIRRSMWWPNCLTSSERSFGAVPSLTGSLPHGERGFTFLEPLPAHFSLLTMLKNNGYQTNYFYGQGAWFHRKDIFLRENLVDQIVDNSSFDDRYPKVLVGKQQFFWGYGDKELFNQSLSILDTLASLPQFNIWFTGTTHSPFFVPDPERYDRILDSLYSIRDHKPGARYINTYRKYLRTVVYADEALRVFFRDYSQLPGYQNTIFIITGDHPMTEIPIHNWLKRYQVPMIIFSPMLQNTGAFYPVVSHYDLMPTLLGFLHRSYSLNFPSQTQSIGTVLDTVSFFRNNHPVAMMNTDRNMLDYFWQDKILADGKYLLRTDSLFNLYPVHDPEMLQLYKEKLSSFNHVVKELCNSNKLVPDSLFLTWMGFRLLVCDSVSQIKMTEENEFYGLLEPITVNNSEDIFLSGYFEGISAGITSSAPSIIVTAGDSNGKTLLWEPVHIDFGRDNFIIRRRFRLDPVLDGSVTIKVYLWNNHKGNLHVKNAVLQLFQNEPHMGAGQ